MVCVPQVTFLGWFLVAAHIDEVRPCRFHGPKHVGCVTPSPMDGRRIPSHVVQAVAIGNVAFPDPHTDEIKCRRYPGQHILVGCVSSPSDGC